MAIKEYRFASKKDNLLIFFKVIQLPSATYQRYTLPNGRRLLETIWEKQLVNVP
jgi:hypothetical protein